MLMLMYLGIGIVVVAVTLNLKIANETEQAFGLISDEVQALRTAVIQNRLALDILLAEKGWVCKILNTSCCFNIPDNHANHSSVITEMRKAAQTPRHLL